MQWLRNLIELIKSPGPKVLVVPENESTQEDAPMWTGFDFPTFEPTNRRDEIALLDKIRSNKLSKEDLWQQRDLITKEEVTYFNYYKESIFSLLIAKGPDYNPLFMFLMSKYKDSVNIKVKEKNISSLLLLTLRNRNIELFTYLLKEFGWNEDDTYKTFLEHACIFLNITDYLSLLRQYKRDEDIDFSDVPLDVIAPIFGFPPELSTSFEKFDLRTYYNSPKPHYPQEQPSYYNGRPFRICVSSAVKVTEEKIKALNFLINHNFLEKKNLDLFKKYLGIILYWVPSNMSENIEIDRLITSIKAKKALPEVLYKDLSLDTDLCLHGHSLYMNYLTLDKPFKEWIGVSNKEVTRLIHEKIYSSQGQVVVINRYFLKAFKAIRSNLTLDIKEEQKLKILIQSKNINWAELCYRESNHGGNDDPPLDFLKYFSMETILKLLEYTTKKDPGFIHSQMIRYYADVNRMFLRYKNFCELENLDLWTAIDKNPKSLVSLHDTLMIEERKIKSQNYSLEKYYPRWLKELEGTKFGPYTLSFPRTNHDLVGAGALLHNCVGGYGDKVVTGASWIMFFKLGESLHVCIEVDSIRKRVVQAKLDRNQSVIHSTEIEDLENLLRSRA